MNILALDTCTESCSAALLYQGEVFDCVEMTQRGHSDLILGMLDTVLERADTSIASIDAVAFGRGPGSFTGVRVGVGVAQGVAYARDIPVIPISSLAAVAQGALDRVESDYLAVAMDARMGEIYCASYQRVDGIVQLLGDEKVCPPEKFLPQSQQKWAGVGTGWGVYAELLEKQFSDNLEQVRVEQYPQATSIIKLAQIEAEAGRMVSADQAFPVYLRNNVAKKKGEQ